MSNSTPTSFWKTSGSLVALAAILAILIGINLLVSRINMRADLTQERIYTLTEGTKATLQKLDQPVTLKFFFSSSAAEIPAPLKSFARQVEDLLREYVRASNGRIILEKYDPAPDSEHEELAQWYGITGQLMGPMGPNLFLGLAAVAGDQQAVMPVIDPRTEETLEYNLTRLIYRISHPQKPTIGILTSLPVMGADIPPYMMAQMNTPKQKPWVAFNELKQDFKVRTIPVESQSIDTNIETLVVIHPRELSETTQFAIDQYLLQGGHLLVFVDPLCAAAIETSREPQQQFAGGPTSSELNRLFNTWGITFDQAQVVADIDSSTMIRGQDGRAEPSPLYLNLTGARLSREEIATASLNTMLMPFAGVFSGEPKDGIKLTPLITTSEKSQSINAMMAQYSPDSIRRDFKSGMKSLNLAVRLQGSFPTAFPEGRPAAKPNPEDDKSAPPPPPAGPTNALAKSIRPGTVILVGDVDLIYDPFCVQSMNFFGTEAHQPINDNVAFLANSIEQLSGGSDLISIRSRGKISRPFTRVLDLARQAQERWMEEERTIEQKLQNVQERLGQLQTKKDDRQKFILSPEQEKEIAAFRKEMVANQRQLKEIRKKLREGIDRLGTKVKLINILLMPLLVAAAGIAYYLYRRSRTVR